MSEPMNLNKFRKAKARAEKPVRAAQNAVKFGRNKAQKRLQEDLKCSAGAAFGSTQA